MQAWLSGEGVDIATIGFLSLVGLPYTFKFLWAPLMDRFELPWLGRRRGWLVLTQLRAGRRAVVDGRHLADAARPAPSRCSPCWWPSCRPRRTWSSTPTAPTCCTRSERGLGSSLNVLGYRLAMILSGGVALIWVDPTQGGGWTWPEVYRFMAWLMVARPRCCRPSRCRA